MTVTSVRKDPQALTMTINVEIQAPIERAWQLWADPRQLERWWGPPMYPATFVDYEPAPGYHATYYMTSPEGQRFYGWWEILDVQPPIRLEVKDGFGDDTGKPNPDMPSGRMVVTLDGRGGATAMEITTYFPSAEAMEQLLKMGQEEGMVQALGQIEGILAEDAAV